MTLKLRSCTLFKMDSLGRAEGRGQKAEGIIFDENTIKIDFFNFVYLVFMYQCKISVERVLFSQDDDFLAEANLRQQERKNFSGVVYAHKLRVSVGDCVRDLEIIAKAAYPEELANRVQYLPLQCDRLKKFN